MQQKAAVNRLYDIHQEFLGFWCVNEYFNVRLKLIIWIWLHFLLQYFPRTAQTQPAVSQRAPNHINAPFPSMPALSQPPFLLI